MAVATAAVAAVVAVAAAVAVAVAVTVAVAAERASVLTTSTADRVVAAGGSRGQLRTFETVKKDIQRITAPVP